MSIPALVFASLLVPLLPANDRETPAPGLSDVTDLVTTDGHLSSLAAALDAAGLVDILRGEGPFTVLAPSDEAFARLPAGALEQLLAPERREALADLLLGHVVPGRLTAIDALAAGRATTLAGTQLELGLSDGRLRVGEARVLVNDLAGRNGLVHVIDRVLLPTPAELPRPQALEVISLAVDRGVPLYNQGQPAACAAVYDLAVLSLLGWDDERLPASARDALSDGLAAASALRDPADRAWVLRFALDEAASQLMDEGAAAPEDTQARGREQRLLFDFADDTTPVWSSVNDDVMGGISRGTMRRSGRGTALYMGALSLDNNGGFSTVRSRASELGLDGWDGIVLRVRGDGRTYNVSAMTNDSRRNVHIWQASFSSVEDEWMEVTVPFNELAHRVMGWTLQDGPVDPSTLRSLAFGISDKDTRPFALEVDWIRAWKGAPTL